MARQAVLGPCRWAVLVASDTSYGMARMWGLMTESSGVAIKPFRTPGEAARWLGLPADYSLRALAEAG
jgi:hypothetical protein